MTGDKLEEPNSEVLTWRTLAQAHPPLRLKLFLRVEHHDGEIDFTTGFWNGESFGLAYPRVTHWALSEAANKVWFKYTWGSGGGNEAPAGRIL